MTLDNECPAIVVAIARNGVIGHGNGLPWSFPEDLRRFRAITMGGAVIMGRRTHESIGKVLPGRLNIVITRDEAWARSAWETTPVPERESLEIVHAPMGALTVAVMSAHYANRKPFIIGGADLYRQALLCASEMHVTRVDVDALGDVYFPQWDASAWRCIEREQGRTRELVFERWVRR